jgi:hypothetical protein
LLVFLSEVNSKTYCLSNAISVIKPRRVRWAGPVTHMGRGDVHKGFWWGMPEGKRPLGRPRQLWEDNIKMNL